MGVETKNRKVMIEEILQFTDLFASKRELENLNDEEIETIYKSSMISFFKKLNNIKTKSK